MTRLDLRPYPADHDPLPCGVALRAEEVLAIPPAAIHAASLAGRHD
jgi:hypothetical protein